MIHRFFMLTGMFSTIPAFALIVLIAVLSNGFGLDDQNIFIRLLAFGIIFYICKIAIRFISAVATVEIERYYR